jgi:glycosyltransferase involved in cell wall biosynthesis
VRILVIIPAYNEAENIAELLKAVRKYLDQADILVINDGSEDTTSLIARQSGAYVLDMPFNLGIGGAVQCGYLFAQKYNYDLLVRQDGDGQHDPADIHTVLAPVLRGDCDFSIGSRYLEKQKGYFASGFRAIGVKVFAMVVSLVARKRFTDTTSGFQAANREAISFLASHLPVDYPEIESVVLLCRAGFQVCEVSVAMRPRQ